ncbi:MAG: CBS domain-containing protein [Proteobacteria bacterium]|nr:CBS domain-containing protein [Pseudomonadota bacterium]
MQAKQLMTPDPACCTPDSRIQDVAQLMRDNDCGEIPVVDDRETRRLVGVVTDRDVAVRAVAEGRGPTDTRASEIMSSSVVSVKPDRNLEECLELMEKNQVRRLPVVDDEGCCIGIISQADIALKARDRNTADLVQDVSRPGSETGGRTTQH